MEPILNFITENGPIEVNLNTKIVYIQYQDYESPLVKTKYEYFFNDMYNREFEILRCYSITKLHEWELFEKINRSICKI